MSILEELSQNFENLRNDYQELEIMCSYLQKMERQNREIIQIVKSFLRINAPDLLAKLDAYIEMRAEKALIKRWK